MHSPGGARLNQVVFVLVNVWLVVGWAWQLMQEVKEQRQERVRRIKEEIKEWDAEIERLEGLMEVCLHFQCGVRRDDGKFADLTQEKQIEEQLLGVYKKAESEVSEGPRVMIEDGQIRFARVGSPKGLRRRGLGPTKLREPSPFSGLRF